MHLFRAKLALRSDSSAGNSLSDVVYKGRDFAVLSGSVLSSSFKARAEDKCAWINSFLKSHQHFPNYTGVEK
jgi:hypothetical protein